jgi:Tol biopolymer transport system component
MVYLLAQTAPRKISPADPAAMLDYAITGEDNMIRSRFALAALIGALLLVISIPAAGRAQSFTFLMYLPTILNPDPCAPTSLPLIIQPPTRERIAFFHGAYEEPPGTTPDLFMANLDNTGRTRLTNDGAMEGRPAWSPDGARIAYVSTGGSSVALKILRLSDRRISTVYTWTTEASVATPAWSPDGTQIAFTIAPFRYSGSYIGVIGVNGTNLRILTNGGTDRSPSWSPDGSRIVFSSARSNVSHLYIMQADGSNLIQLTNHQAWDFEPAWSPDGSRIAYVSDCIGTGGRASIYTIQADGTGRVPIPKPIYETGQNYPTWSPDSKRIAYSQGFFKGGVIYIVNLDGSSYSQFGNFKDAAPSWSPR